MGEDRLESIGLVDPIFCMFARVGTGATKPTIERSRATCLVPSPQIPNFHRFAISNSSYREARNRAAMRIEIVVVKERPNSVGQSGHCIPLNRLLW